MSAPVTRFHKLILVGSGQVVRDRIRPALPRLRLMGVRQVIYLDVFDRAPFRLADDERYLRAMPGSRLPLEALSALDALGPTTLAVVCTPTGWHLHYCEQLHPLVGRVACEKPLTRDHAAAQLLLATQPNLQPISHFLHKQAMRDWLAYCQGARLPWLPHCVGVRVDLLESRDVGRRDVDPVLHDLGWHAWELLLAPFRAAGKSAAVELEAARTATYAPRQGEALPPGGTAARLSGRAFVGGFWVPFDFRLGKGLGADSKTLCYFFDTGGSIRIDLSESGPLAHRRVLEELLTAERPDLGVDLADAIELVRLCALSQGQARDEGSHPIGQMPALLSEDALMGLYF
jgi:hypothetical protein